MGPKRQKMSAEDAIANILQIVEGGDKLEDDIGYEAKYTTKNNLVKVDRHKNNDIYYKFDNAHVGWNNRASVIRDRQGVVQFANDTRTNREAF